MTWKYRSFGILETAIAILKERAQKLLSGLVCLATALDVDGYGSLCPKRHVKWSEGVEKVVGINLSRE